MDILKSTLNVINPLPRSEGTTSKDALSRNVDRKVVPPNRAVSLTWTAPLRPFVPRTPIFYKRMWSLIIVICIILAIVGLAPLSIVLFGVCVLYYVLTNVPPEKVKHEIDNYGIHYLGSQYYWTDFKYFYFVKEGDYEILSIDTVAPYPGRMRLILDGVSIEQLKSLLSQNLPMKETPPETMLDKMYKKVCSKISLE